MKLTRPQRELIYLLGYGLRPKMQHRWMSYWALRRRGYVYMWQLTPEGLAVFKEICHDTRRTE